MDLKRQDRNGVRTPVDLQRRINIKGIEQNTKEIERINRERVVDSTLSLDSTNAIQNKAVAEALQQIVSDVNTAISDVNTAIEDVEDSIHTSIEDMFQVVNSLPATGEKGIIYLLSNGNTTNDLYDEYIFINNSWEKFGTYRVINSTEIQHNNITLNEILGNHITSFDIVTENTGVTWLLVDNHGKIEHRTIPNIISSYGLIKSVNYDNNNTVYTIDIPHRYNGHINSVLVISAYYCGVVSIGNSSQIFSYTLGNLNSANMTANIVEYTNTNVKVQLTFSGTQYGGIKVIYPYYNFS